MNRRDFIKSAGTCVGALALTACDEDIPPERYNQEDQFALQAQRLREQEASGKGPYGKQVYQGYRGLADLPWFELDAEGDLRCVDDSIPSAVDVHCHLGMAVLFSPALDLLDDPRPVRHLLDCDYPPDGCRLDLDIYANGNFTEQGLKTLSRATLAQGLWRGEFARTHTIPNLLAEMDAMQVQQAHILPIKMGFPFGDDLTTTWRQAIAEAKASDRLVAGCSVHPRSSTRLEELRAHAAAGASLVKLHPTVQAFYPDQPDMMPIYEEAQRLGLIVFFHGGRAGIEPESRQRYAPPRHYEAVLADFPNLQVVLGHAGARDGEQMLELATRYANAWLGTHGQGVTALDSMITTTGGERLLFGTDWPFYHIGMSLAKVLICTESKHRAQRSRILRDNAVQLLASR